MKVNPLQHKLTETNKSESSGMSKASGALQTSFKRSGFNQRPSVFSQMSSAKVLEISNRLSVPKHTDVIPKRRKTKVVGGDNPKITTQRRKRSTTKTEGQENTTKGDTVHTQVTYEDQRRHVDRLSRPTVLGQSRENFRYHCKRCLLQPSQRHFPEAYRNWLFFNPGEGDQVSFKDC